jgi:hypothetical protein
LGGAYRLHLQGRNINQAGSWQHLELALIVRLLFYPLDAPQTSSCPRTTRRYNTEDRSLQVTSLSFRFHSFTCVNKCKLL